METTKTPCADLLAMLTETVSVPTFATKMASAGMPAKDVETVQKAMTIGGQVRAEIVKRAAEIADPFASHIAKTASALGLVNSVQAEAAAASHKNEAVDATFSAGLAAL